ncbi:MAG: ABC transporter substrate-binding protein [Spirochaetales bacterium]|nr:ABC transporter substrate-binding protein [Spirochaetales bacterium]
MSKRIGFIFMFAVIITAIGFANGQSEGPQETKAVLDEISEFDGRQQEPSAAAAGVTEFSEAPMLAELVAAGKLPSLEDRIPSDPVIVFPVNRIGEYGGSVSRQGGGGEWRMFNHEPLTRWCRDFTDEIPNIVESWEFNSDATECTYYLKKGIRWSDGEPYTANDFMFYWNDMVLDDLISITPSSYMRSADGQLMTVTMIDDYTIHFEFGEPKPLFNRYMTRGSRGSAIMSMPSHYLKQFHPRFTPGANANELIDRHLSAFEYTDMPVLTAWVTKIYEPGQRIVAERNPYYWKVDPQGRQLPYIDTIVSDISNSESEIDLLRVINGDVDLNLRPNFGNLNDIPVLRENAEKKDYRVIEYSRGDIGKGLIIPKYANKDPMIRDMLFNQKFRQGISHAINRERVRQVVLKGFGKVQNFALPGIGPQFSSPEGREFAEEWPKAFTEYDIDLANNLLDEAGYVDLNGNGWRQYPDGSQIDLMIDVQQSSGGDTEAMAELVKQDWEAVGLMTSLNVIAGTLWAARSENADPVFSMREDGSASGLIIAEGHWVPSLYEAWTLAPLAGLWYQTNGERGFDPRGTFLDDINRNYTQAIISADEDQRNKLALEAAKIHVDEGPILLTLVGGIPAFSAAKNNIKNIPNEASVGSWHLSFPGAINPEQFYLEK